MASGGAEKYGQRYWCIGLTDKKRTDVYCYADRVEVTPSGAVVLWRDEPEKVNPNLIFSAGQWAFVYAASVLDGHAVAVEHWPGQISEGKKEG